MRPFLDARFSSRGSIVALFFLLVTTSAMGQSFDLVEPNGVVTGRIAIESGYLTYWDQSGERVTYQRNRRYDTPDRLFIGYYNRPLARVLKFPRSGSGRFIYADLDDPIPADAFSIRQVRRTGTRQVLIPGAGLGTLPGFGIGPSLGASPGFGVSPVPSPIIPGRGGRNGTAGGAFGTGGFGTGGFAMGPLGNVPPIGYVPPPRSLLLDSQTVPLPALPPANVTFLNGGNRELQVSMTDATNPRATQSLRIKPGQSQKVMLHRDAGEQLVQRFEVVTPSGDIVTQEKTRSIPPPPRYKITVHQWRVQSIAIDRTQGGHNAIEDVNIQGQPVGSFSLPPGPQLTDGTIDVFRAAKSMGNQGALAPLVPQQSLSGEQVSPLEKAILNLP